MGCGQQLARLTDGSGGRTRTGDTAIMSRLLFRLSYTAFKSSPALANPAFARRASHEPQYGIEP